MSFGSRSLPWNKGEKEMHRIMHVAGQGNPNSPFLSPGAGYMVQGAPLLALGTLDDQDRPWTTIWGGDPGFGRPVAKNVIGIKTAVDRRFDPVVEALIGGADEGEIVREEGEGRMVGGLTIDLESRMRVKLHGHMIAGAMEGDGDKEKGVGQMQLVVSINKSVGNCPKYLNSKRIVPFTPQPKLISDSPQLPPEALSLLNKADMFFMSSSDGSEDVDTNHRGGPAGFVRVISNDESGAVIVYPEYSGNRMYESLGNLKMNPFAGITVPDFDTGDVLYLTGKTEILIGKEAGAVLLRSNLAVKVTITSARFVEKGLTFTGIPEELSPYNPPVRYAANEKVAHDNVSDENPNHATLLNTTKLTPTISRFRFSIEDPDAIATWKPGQYATLAFEDYLDQGYSHMRDEDPQSLNDDFLRTFTVSSPPSSSNKEFELTIRKVGRVTNFLFEQQRRAKLRGGFQVPLKGFGGEFRFAKKAGGIIPVIAGGIGITPLLGQIDSMDLKQLRLLWGIGIEDIGLVADTLKRYPQLVGSTTIFLSGEDADLELEELKLLKKVVETGVRIERRRVGEEDVARVNEEEGVDEWYMCVGPRLKSSILNWLAGRRVVYEDFGY